MGYLVSVIVLVKRKYLLNTGIYVNKVAKTHTIHHLLFLLVYVVKHYPKMADAGQTSEEQFVIQNPQHIR